MNKHILITLLLLSIIFSANAQKSHVWMSYGQSKFLYAPGIEANFTIYEDLGIQVGVASYIQDYKREQIINVTDDYKFNFYNANLGISYHIKINKNHSLLMHMGTKFYYGPNFEVLHHYKEGGYNIYFDSSGLRPKYGIDLGCSYSYKRWSILLKYDTARSNFRIGIGRRLGKKRSIDQI